LGYEDLNDHDELRKDPTFAVLAGATPNLRPAPASSIQIDTQTIPFVAAQGR
jgi:hypothetical protein